MGMTIDDNVKQILLDKLSEEPTMVINTAYIYAKNFVDYGEDITKAWTTAVQQASIIQDVRQKAWVEAYDSFKSDYENCLKALRAEFLQLKTKTSYVFVNIDDVLRLIDKHMESKENETES